MTMGTFARDEVEAAWAAYKSKPPSEHDRNGWLKEHPSLTTWIEWEIVDGDRIGFYNWNNLPDPTGEGRRFAFPNTTFLTYGGNGEFSYERDYFNQPDVDRVFAEWKNAGGDSKTPPDSTLRGIEGWAPEPSETVFPREEIEAEFARYREQAALAVATGDWEPWAAQFTDDAHYREHHYGYFRSQREIRDWILSVMKPFPTMQFPVSWYVIDGNRLSALIPNVLPPPEGDDGYYGFDVNTILHYAGDGKWSYEEDVYSLRDAEEAVKRWVMAGGTIPS